MMTVLWILLLLIGLILVYILCVPIILEINTNSGWYGLRVGRQFSLRIVLDEITDPQVEWRYVWWHKRWSVLRELARRSADSPPKTDEQTPAKKKKKKRKKRPALSFSSLRALLATFTCQRFYLDMDTGDVVRNAWLYPVGAFCQARGWPVAVNFEGRQTLIFQLENRLGRLLWAWLRSP